MTAVVLLVAVGCLGYVAAARQLRRRGDRWPLPRDAAVCAGGAALIVSVAAPWDQWPPFTGHMAAHLGTGMIAPLLFVLGRPVTLALRALPVGPRRRLLSCVRSRPAALLVWPPLAALMHITGLWAVYRTPVMAAAHHRPWLDTLVSVHLLASGVLFAFAVLALDPLRHRAGFALRGGALLAASAAHGILAKSLYAAGPPGTSFTTADLHLASYVMYYGGDVVGVALAVLLCHQWYAAEGRALVRASRSRPASS
ncbi:cytochrome c oxidase assembly protein [Streptomyces sp. BA2]|uniref:cytochrome c oxidase assembly protein n=1 Tax=Streptomyces sp. BA2 TaxID=436595 RepID=UPI00132C1B6B|nr:cytochrome c oxidase assembly protein [Streptomyces sp. BA2]MWA15857.1 cytochrome c oxidase assembly protein [Streptomyces sp. BA2]